MAEGTWIAVHLHTYCRSIPHAYSFVVRGSWLQFKSGKTFAAPLTEDHKGHQIECHLVGLKKIE